MEPDINPPSSVGELIRKLMRERGLSGKQLAERAEISATALSLILGDRYAPRRDTLSKILGALDLTEEQTTALVLSYAGVTPATREHAGRQAGSGEPRSGSKAATTVTERSDFEKDIWQTLSNAGLKLAGNPTLAVPYDIMIDTAPRVYVICKTSVRPSDWFEAIGRALFRKHQVRNAQAIVVVPYKGLYFEKIADFFKKSGVPVATPDTIVETARKLTKAPARGARAIVDRLVDGESGTAEP